MSLNETEPKVLSDLKKLEKSSEWKKAEALVKEHKAEFEPGVFYYNLGIIKLKQEDFVGARISLEMAKKNAYESLILDEALKEVETKLSATAIESSSAWERVEISLIQLPVQFYLSLTLLILIVFILVKKYFSSLITKIFWVLFALIPLLFKILVFPTMSEVISLNDVPVLFGPSQVFEKVSELPPGIKIFVKKNNEEHSQWYQILYPKNLNGWIENKNIEFIGEADE